MPFLLETPSGPTARQLASARGSSRAMAMAFPWLLFGRSAEDTAGVKQRERGEAASV